MAALSFSWLTLKGLSQGQEEAFGCWKPCRAGSSLWVGVWEGHGVICALSFAVLTCYTAMDHQNEFSYSIMKCSRNKKLKHTAFGFKTGQQEEAGRSLRRRLVNDARAWRKPSVRAYYPWSEVMLLKAGGGAENWTHSCLQQCGKIENVSNILYDLAKEMSRQNIENATYLLLAAYKIQLERGQLKRELFSF